MYKNSKFKLFMQDTDQNFDFCQKSVPCGTLGVPCGTESVSCGTIHQPNGQIFKRVLYSIPNVPCGTEGVPYGTVHCTNSSNFSF